MLHVVWWGRSFVHHVYSWQNQGEEQLWWCCCCWFVFSPAWFPYLRFVLDGWQCLRNWHRQPCVSFIAHTVVSLNGRKLLCCCLLLWFSFLPSLCLVFTLSALCHFHAQPPSLHLHHWHSRFFSLLAILYVTQPLSVSICLCLFWIRTNGERYAGLNPAERHAEPGPSYHILPEYSLVYFTLCFSSHLGVQTSSKASFRLQWYCRHIPRRWLLLYLPPEMNPPAASRAWHKSK